MGVLASDFMELDKKDHYIEIFMGTDYEFPGDSGIEAIGDLKNYLEKIVSDLPDDFKLKISEVHAHDGKVGYTFEKGTPQ